MLNIVVQIVTVLLHTHVSNDSDVITLPVQSDSSVPQDFVFAKDISVRCHSLGFGVSVVQVLWHPSGG